MSDVIEFPGGDEPEEIWVCGCGCRSFELRADGTAACSACFSDLDVDGGGWYDIVADGPKWDRETPIFVDLAGGDTADFARAKVAKAASDPSARAVVVVWEGDRVTAWVDAGTTEELEEISELIDSYKTMTAIKVGAYE